ncbi:YdeI/OmpD-associated family protein [Flavobacterium pectinovorum]|uniref:YdeI/OmpD-associated family protein n=1 Tax=Flavobacterium pectinovorum TaxID=29533 RepID=UPI00293E7E23|nr:YdeI/OmpD-associated family protein [Flavobacterium pectinovorum]
MKRLKTKNKEKSSNLPKKEAIISELLKKEMDQNPVLKEAFQKLSPYKQYEFLEYIESAKQEKTKISRIEKVIPMILGNVGLNDKYR